LGRASKRTPAPETQMGRKKTPGDLLGKGPKKGGRSVSTAAAPSAQERVDRYTCSAKTTLPGQSERSGATQDKKTIKEPKIALSTLRDRGPGFGLKLRGWRPREREYHPDPGATVRLHEKKGGEVLIVVLQKAKGLRNGPAAGVDDGIGQHEPA